MDDIVAYVNLYAMEHSEHEGWWRITHLFGRPFIRYIIEENNLDTKTKAIAHFCTLANLWEYR